MRKELCGHRHARHSACSGCCASASLQTDALMRKCLCSIGDSPGTEKGNSVRYGSGALWLTQQGSLLTWRDVFHSREGVRKEDGGDVIGGPLHICQAGDGLHLSCCRSHAHNLRQRTQKNPGSKRVRCLSSLWCKATATANHCTSQPPPPPSSHAALALCCRRCLNSANTDSLSGLAAFPRWHLKWGVSSPLGVKASGECVYLPGASPRCRTRCGLQALQEWRHYGEG